MTLSADHDPHTQNEGETTGKALEPAADATVAALAHEAASGASAPRSTVTRLLDYGAYAAMIVGLLGFAWTIGDHVVKRETTPVALATPAIPKVDEAAALRLETQKMAADITALRQSLDGLRSAIRQDKTTEQMHALAANLDGVKTGLSATKTETAAALASLATKIDHLPHNEAMAKIQTIVDRLDKMERETADQTPTASVVSAPKATPAPPVQLKATPIALPPVKPATVKPAEADAMKKPPILPDWVTREVYDGVAVVESKHGPMEVGIGDSLPGAGTVKSIDRHGTAWIVTTSKGQLAFAPPPRDRAPRDYYRAGPRDF